MGQEYFINSQELEDRVRSLLPSQGGAGAGFDLSASTQIIPVIDLTESAEGSNVRQDLQTALSFSDVTSFDVTNTTTTIINNTGYFRIFGNANIIPGSGALDETFLLSDGASDKVIKGFKNFGNPVGQQLTYDFIVFIAAGNLCKITATVQARFIGCTRQIADINGNLNNPS